MNQIYLIIAILFCISSCTKNQSKDYSQEMIRPLNPDQVILDYNGGQVTVKDVEEKLSPQFARVREQLLNAYIKAAEDVLIDREKEKLALQPSEVTNIEIENYIKANNLPRTETDKVKALLSSEKNRIQRQIGKMKIFNDLNVQNKLGAARYDIQATTDMPTQGPNSASVTIQVFCDFSNPICNRTRLLLGEIKNQFGNKVRWIYRHFPVASNPLGEEAAQIAICAHLENAFWPVHDRFFDQQAQLTKENLITIATQSGISSQKISSCLQQAQFQELLQKDIKAAQDLGLTQTPAFFVNGTKINDIEQLKAFVASQAQK